MGEIVMKEFVRYGARAWTELKEPFRVPYVMMAEVDRVRYDRDKYAMMNGGLHGHFEQLLLQA